MKRLITSMLVILLISVAFIGSFYKGYYSYAEDINYMSDEELEAAYQAYLQSKGGSLIGNAGARLAYTNGKMLNFLTSEYNTTPYKNINQVKGLLSWEKAELESGNSSVLQLTMRHPEVFSLYTQWLLQNKFLGNGVEESNGMFDDGTDNNLFQGHYYTYQNHTCLCYEGSSAITFTPITNLTVKGSPYIYSTNDLISNGSESGVNLNFPYSSNYNKTWKIYYYDSWTSGGHTYRGGAYEYDQERNTNYSFYLVTDGVLTWYGYPCVFYENGNYYANRILFKATDNTYLFQFRTSDSSIKLNIDDDTEVGSTNIFFYTNVNNNITNYPNIDADGTLYITPKVKVGVDYQPYTVNEGDTIQNVVNNYYNDSGEKDKTITVPSTTPDSGSGGGSSGGTLPNWSNPYPNLSPDGNGGFNFNFSLPDLNIDWNINGLSEKFPFSIPFDLIRFVSILNAEPETPHFEGTVNLIVYEWNIDADLSDFDNLAGIVRNVEFIGFCITLILITRRMIKG